MGVSNINAKTPAAEAEPAEPLPPPIPGREVMATHNHAYGYHWNMGRSDSGALLAGNFVSDYGDMIHGKFTTVAHFGKAKEGTDITKMLGRGRAAHHLWADYNQYVGTKLSSRSSARHAKHAGQRLEAYMKDANKAVSDNPWGKGPDAAAAAIQFEKQFMANDAAALREMTDLQRRQYGAAYEIVRPPPETPPSPDLDNDGRRINNPAQTNFQFIAPTRDLNAIEQYKLMRYELRDIHTGKAVGSGQDDYNPLGMMEDDRFQPGAFIQDEAEFAQTRVAGREARQSGKKTLTTTDTKSVQL